MALEPVSSPEGRAYEWNGKLHPSVTTIIGGMNKPWLANWMVKNAAEWAASHLDQLADLDYEQAVAVIKSGARSSGTDARDRGTRVHAHLEDWLLNGRSDDHVIEDVEPEDIPWFLAGIKFCDDHVARVLHTEGTVFNTTYLYAGTADLIAELHDGRTAVIDWKTGKRLYPETALQLTAYANGEYLVTNDLEEHEMPDIELGIAVRLTEHGTYIAKEADTSNPRLWKTFVALRTIAKYQQIADGTLSDYAKGKATLDD
jgi:hypothetical protein